MSAQTLLIQLGSRLINTEDFKSKTNAATGAGALLGSAATLLAQVPEPNAQAAAAVLGLASFICLWWKDKDGKIILDVAPKPNEELPEELPKGENNV